MDTHYAIKHQESGKKEEKYIFYKIYDVTGREIKKK